MTNHTHLEVSIAGSAPMGDLRLYSAEYDDSRKITGSCNGGGPTFKDQEEAIMALEVQAGIQRSLKNVYIKKSVAGFEAWPMANRAEWPLFERLENEMFAPIMQRTIKRIMRPFGDGRDFGTQAGVNCLMTMLDFEDPENLHEDIEDDIDFIDQYVTPPAHITAWKSKQVSVFSDKSVEIWRRIEFTAFSRLGFFNDDISFFSQMKYRYDRLFLKISKGRKMNNDDLKWLELHAYFDKSTGVAP